MIPWNERSIEEQSLLSPAFCALLLWNTAYEYRLNNDTAISFEELFLVFPLTLHRESRETLPNNIRTPLAEWINNHPLIQGHVAHHSRLMVPFTKEAIIYGGAFGLFRLDLGRVHAEAGWRNRVGYSLRTEGDEVSRISRAAGLLGR